MLHALLLWHRVGVSSVCGRHVKRRPALLLFTACMRLTLTPEGLGVGLRLAGDARHVAVDVHGAVDLQVVPVLLQLHRVQALLQRLPHTVVAVDDVLRAQAETRQQKWRYILPSQTSFVRAANGASADCGKFLPRPACQHVWLHLQQMYGHVHVGQCNVAMCS